MYKFLRSLLLGLILLSTLHASGFYDSASWGNYKILSNSEEEGYTVEFTSSDLLDVSIPETVTYSGTTYTVVGIGANAFKNKTLNVDKLVLPSTLTYIGDQAFYNTKFQTPNKNRTYKLSLPGNITKIGNDAFMNAYAHNEGKIEVALPKNLEEVPYRCFLQANFNEVSINQSCKVIGNNAFGNFTGSIYVPVNNSISQLGSSPFSNTHLSSITLPEIEDLSSSSFYGCTELTNVTIGNKITLIPNSIFSTCINLKKATFQGAVTSIEDGAFKNCSMMTELVIADSNSLTTIGNNAFQYCNRLAALDICNAVESIGNYAFDGCTALLNFGFPDSLKSIGNYAFRGCKHFDTLIFPDDLESIGSNAFSDMNVLNVLIGASIRTIGNNAFSFNEEANLMLKAQYPTEAYESLIPSLPSGIIIYVPSACLSHYQNAEQWKDFLVYYNLPTWGLDHINSNYGEEIDLQLKYFTSYDIPSSLWPDEKGEPIITADWKNWENAGTYPVSVSWNNTPHDRIVVLLEEEWTINKIPLKIRARDAERQYGEENPGIHLYYEGFIKDQTADVLEKLPKVVIDAMEDSPVGRYDIKVSGAEALNYKMEYIDGILTIVPASQTIQWDQELDNCRVGGEIELLAAASSGLDVSYESSDTEIATIEGNMIKFLSEGFVTIKASQPGNENYLEAKPVERIIYVWSLTIERLYFDVNEISIKKDETMQLTPSWEPAEVARPELKWTSSNPEVASVDEDGLVSGIEEGEAVITVELKDNPDISASCTITVGIKSGVEEITSSSSEKIKVEGRILYILSNLNSPIELYSMDGRLVYVGVEKEIVLSDGLYLLSINGQSIKIKI